MQSDFNDAIDCIDLGPCNLYFWVCTTEQDISDPCVNGTITTPKLQHQKTLHQINFWQFKWCSGLHCVASNKFPPMFFMYVMFSAQMVCWRDLLKKCKLCIAIGWTSMAFMAGHTTSKGRSTFLGSENRVIVISNWHVSFMARRTPVSGF